MHKRWKTHHTHRERRGDTGGDTDGDADGDAGGDTGGYVGGDTNGDVDEDSRRSLCAGFHPVCLPASWEAHTVAVVGL